MIKCYKPRNHLKKCKKPVRAAGQTDAHIKLAKQKKKGEAFCFFEYGKQFRQFSHLKV